MSEFAKMTTYKKEEFLEKEILKYLQKLRQPATRIQIAEYLVKNTDSIPNDSLKYVTSKKTGREYIPFMNRLSFAITSLKKAELIDHPKRRTTVLTKLGQEINPDNEEYIHELVMKGGLNYEIGCTSLKINSSKFQ
ncbi:winged helix-turn-helix domain-containing protein [Limosilactobacillus reuteri]|uniref:Restriction system protein Mrr-like N-terminal domain-containing protein n=2 Tax=Limosilactobacillus reuteri TaxID=1598 RepID=A0A256VHD2_LIMRT|nr:winged helix-turn-helix domain-containing protein [Limosilactobacillus reuteri]OYS60035.1 hypothetical protein CBF91_08125 [Limosilactobacillus reuteri]OYS78389.1 hypothetical protein CBG07_00380 [Limosilactobacillus reuteri]OYS80504.1 hypothetical protein CBG05_00365 [Limosilactobacillus reuteri]OYS89103.1 hypothetical protein CBG06_06670 [Limosilactobacillus reuteri]OYT02620.1 hypothetical protein CBG21_07960 [Limosilactobacillus reuteri]